MKTSNELERVRSLIAGFKTSGTTRAAFARRHKLHPSAFSRILKVEELPQDVLDALAALPSLSRTHLEVIATAPAERRAALIEAVRAGRSTYRLRDRRESTRVQLASEEQAPPPKTMEVATSEIARALGATDEEAAAFAAELLLVLWRSGRDRVEGSFAAFRAARARADRKIVAA